MADTTLKTDYKDDVLDTSKNTQRKYQIIQNNDGTVSFVDVTEYSQVGDSFGGTDINATNKAVCELYSDIPKYKQVSFNVTVSGNNTGHITSYIGRYQNVTNLIKDNLPDGAEILTFSIKGCFWTENYMWGGIANYVYPLDDMVVQGSQAGDYAVELNVWYTE